MAAHAWICIDIETAADPAAVPLLDEPVAAANLRDPEKIAADLAVKREDQRARLGLDPFAGRIIAVAYQTEDMGWPAFGRADTDEDSVLFLLGGLINSGPEQHRKVVGYNLLAFDWPFMATRARLLGVRMPALDTRKYGNRDIVDVYAALTFDGSLERGVMRRTLQRMARRFGLIDAEDTTSGADIQALVDAGRWDDIAAHVTSDVALTVALARRLDLIR